MLTKLDVDYLKTFNCISVSHASVIFHQLNRDNSMIPICGQGRFSNPSRFVRNTAWSFYLQGLIPCISCFTKAQVVYMRSLKCLANKNVDQHEIDENTLARIERQKTLFERD